MKAIKGGNETTVGKTTIGSAIALVSISLFSRFVVDLGAETGAALVGGFTIIFNYFMPVKKKQG
jgi:hypothetical protein